MSKKAWKKSGDLYPLECTQDHYARDLGLLILKEMCSLVPRPILDIKWQMGLGTRLRNVMGQCTERSSLVSMLFLTFLNPLKFFMEIINILVRLLFT